MLQAEARGFGLTAHQRRINLVDRHLLEACPATLSVQGSAALHQFTQAHRAQQLQRTPCSRAAQLRIAQRKGQRPKIQAMIGMKVRQHHRVKIHQGESGCA